MLQLLTIEYLLKNINLGYPSLEKDVHQEIKKVFDRNKIDYIHEPGFLIPYDDEYHQWKIVNKIILFNGCKYKILTPDFYIKGFGILEIKMTKLINHKIKSLVTTERRQLIGYSKIKDVESVSCALFNDQYGYFIEMFEVKDATK